MATPKKLLLGPKARRTLVEADPALAVVLDQVGACRLTYGNASCDLESLVRAILFQQLSGKAAATIYGRFRGLFRGSRFPSARAIAALQPAQLRAVGVSGPKQRAIADLCARVLDRSLPVGNLGHLPDPDLIARLTAVRGIGRWSAHMFMLFHLGRRDVWPVDDLGIRKGVQRLRGLDALPSARAMEALGAPYEGHRGVVAWYLWHWLDGDAAG